MIIPTGIGCEIGGHAGDANPVAKLIASACDKLILHPNVVNASDINEMPENCLYVEGSILDRFLRGEICLEEVKNNKVLVVANSPIKEETINSVSAGRVTSGLDAKVLELTTSLRMIGTIEKGIATGEVFGWEELVEQVEQYDFDALAITSLVEVEREVRLNYLKNGGVNPWGGVEAKASRLIATALNKPVAHSPIGNPDIQSYKEIVDPRISPEVVSVSYLHCILKGLHKAPRISDKGLNIEDVDCLVSPYKCFGEPHKACLKANIPVIVVKENQTVLDVPMDNSFIYVENYLEAIGVINAMKTGVTIESVRRPIASTKVFYE